MPKSGVWDYLNKRYGQIDMTKSFYCARLEKWTEEGLLCEEIQNIDAQFAK
jgi:hypothetical protein